MPASMFWRANPGVKAVASWIQTDFVCPVQTFKIRFNFMSLTHFQGLLVVVRRTLKFVIKISGLSEKCIADVVSRYLICVATPSVLCS
jgi:hypothetical protein